MIAFVLIGCRHISTEELYPAASKVDMHSSFAAAGALTQGDLSQSLQDRAAVEYEQIKDVVDRIEKDVNKWGIHDALVWLDDHGLEQLAGW